jgi:hypothetical protein
MARAREAYSRGDIETAKRELQFVARTSLEDVRALGRRASPSTKPEAQ